jgi:hypothetical protein
VALREVQLLKAEWFVGIDWAADAHEVCIEDRAGRICERCEVKHTATALQGFVDALLDRAEGDPARIAIGIEVPRGALVELCVERGVTVYAINPKQVDRFRDRFTVAGAKDDPRDAYVISDALRTDAHAFRPVRLDHPVVIQLREWSRLDNTLRDELTRFTNQLRDHVFPVVPVRQWVLSLPHRLRYVLAWDHALCRAVTGVFVRAVLGSLRRRARRQGAPDGRGGAVAIVQRFGAALNLNIHVHALVLDGVYVEDGVALRFHACDPPTDDEMDRLLKTIERRLDRLLARRGVVDAVGDDAGADRWGEEAPVLAGIAAASVQGRLALGERAGAAVRRGGGSAELLALAPQASDRATRGATASTCTPASSSRCGIERGSSGCAATPCGRPSRTTGSI